MQFAGLLPTAMSLPSLPSITKVSPLIHRAHSWPARSPTQTIDDFSPLPPRASFSLQLQHNLLRILGQNPGKFTLQGTNTYLVGPKHSLILIDTAQGLEEYLPVLSEAFKRLSVGANFPLEGSTTTQADEEEKAEIGKVELKEIILTHYHGDHVEGLASVLKLVKDYGFGGVDGGPRVWKVPAGKEHDDEIEESLAGLTDQFQSPPTTAGSPFKYLHQLTEGTRFGFKTKEYPSNEDELEIILTPGHTTDSISLLYTAALSHSSPTRSTSLFTADTVLGHGTAVFEDLSAYIASLQKCVERLEKEDERMVTLWPGHGEVIEDGVGKMKEYIRHRLERENQVVDALKHFSTSSTPSSADGTNQGTSAELFVPLSLLSHRSN